MTMFDDRERGFEAKFAYDQDVLFRVTARRDKLFGQWIADLLHLSPEARSELAQSMLHVADGPGHDKRVLDHAAARCAAQGEIVSEAQLAASLKDCAGNAERQLFVDPH